MAKPLTYDAPSTTCGGGLQPPKFLQIAKVNCVSALTRLRVASAWQVERRYSRSEFFPGPFSFSAHRIACGRRIRASVKGHGRCRAEARASASFQKHGPAVLLSRR